MPAMDTAIIDIINETNDTLFVWKQLTECYKCPLLVWKNKIIPYFNDSDIQELEVNTNYGIEYAIADNNVSSVITYCSQTKNLDDQSRHTLTIKLNESSTDNYYYCDFVTTQEGRNNIWPLIGAILIYILFAILFYSGRRLYYKWRNGKAVVITAPNGLINGGLSVVNEKPRKRLNSLDCFRGVTILMMIFANYGSGDYQYLDHAKWDGFHFADIIFPWFIFIMGTTMAISFKSMVIRQKVPISKIMYRIVKRSLVLFAIGLILNSMGRTNLKTLRIPGVLQRFAISYLVVASAHVLSLHLHKGELFGALRIHQLVDIIPYWPEWLLMIAMASLHFGLSFGYKFSDDCPVGYIGPGGLYDNASHPYCTGGAANTIDNWIFSKNHTYQHFTAAEIYDPEKNYKISHDPEGALGVTTSIILTFLGLQMGKILIAYPNPRQKITRWLSWGLVLAGLCATFAVTDWIPINKNLWSFSFICLAASAACFAISLLYYVIDVIRLWPNGQPFHYPGMNSILLYIGHEITGEMLPWSIDFGGNSHVGPLASNLIGVTLWFAISVVLAEKEIFLTV